MIKSPKLYFYDTGVACSLLGIKSTEQLATHAAKGALFENLIVSELLKERLNAGANDNLYFWRDKTGHEIDLLADEVGNLQIFELKSAETISSDFFSGLDYFSKVHTGVQQRILVYGGKQAQNRSNGIRVKPWNEL